MPQTKREKAIAISAKHPSGHGHITKASNDAFVAGVKYEQAKARLTASAKAGKPHEKLSMMAVKVQKLKMKHDKLMAKSMKENP